jgi:hypothetical protein
MMAGKRRYVKRGRVQTAVQSALVKAPKALISPSPGPRVPVVRFVLS